MPIETQAPVLPHFKVVVLNETEYWSDEIRARAGLIYQAYLFDANRHVHCCEITPSYELYPLYATPQNDDDDGTIATELATAGDSEVTYMHVRRLDKLSPDHFYSYGEELKVPESWEELRDHYEEQARSNCVIEFPAGVPPRIQL